MPYHRLGACLVHTANTPQIPVGRTLGTVGAAPRVRPVGLAKGYVGGLGSTGLFVKECKL